MLRLSLVPVNHGPPPVNVILCFMVQLFTNPVGNPYFTLADMIDGNSHVPATEECVFMTAGEYCFLQDVVTGYRTARVKEDFFL